jgi:hypothetical protein
MTHTQRFLIAIAAIVMVGAMPSVTTAQTSAPPVNQGGPMTIEPIEQHFSIAPEYKVSQLNGTTGQLLGGHAGVFITKNILVGGGLYTMLNGEHHEGLTYGGGLIGWEPWSTAKVGVDLRALVGYGSGTTSETVTLTTRDRRGLVQGTVQGSRFLSSGLFIAEPQVDFLMGLTKHLRLSVGGGYRFAMADHVDNDLFSGASGTIALRFGSAR